jgi:hypothetical protein
MIGMAPRVSLGKAKRIVIPNQPNAVHPVGFQVHAIKHDDDTVEGEPMLGTVSREWYPYRDLKIFCYDFGSMGAVWCPLCI